MQTTDLCHGLTIIVEWLGMNPDIHVSHLSADQDGITVFTEPTDGPAISAAVDAARRLYDLGVKVENGYRTTDVAVNGKILRGTGRFQLEFILPVKGEAAKAVRASLGMPPAMPEDHEWHTTIDHLRSIAAGNQ